MKVVIIGGTGLIGSAVVKELGARHDVICVGNKGGEYTVNIEDKNSIKSLYQKIGTFNALVLATGRVAFSPLTKMSTEQLLVGINSKLMGQVHCVLLGLEHMADNGSYTLTSGILDKEPIFTGAAGTMVNAGIHGFIKAAAIEMPRGIRINAVSPTVVTEAMDAYGPYFRGFEPAPVARVAMAYSKSVEGLQTGQIYEVH